MFLHKDVPRESREQRGASEITYLRLRDRWRDESRENRGDCPLPSAIVGVTENKGASDTTTERNLTIKIPLPVPDLRLREWETRPDEWWEQKGRVRDKLIYFIKLSRVTRRSGGLGQLDSFLSKSQPIPLFMQAKRVGPVFPALLKGCYGYVHNLFVRSNHNHMFLLHWTFWFIN